MLNASLTPGTNKTKQINRIEINVEIFNFLLLKNPILNNWN